MSRTPTTGRGIIDKQSTTTAYHNGDAGPLPAAGVNGVRDGGSSAWALRAALVLVRMRDDLAIAGSWSFLVCDGIT